MLAMAIEDPDDSQLAISHTEEVVLVLLIGQIELSVHRAVAATPLAHELYVSLMKDLREGRCVGEVL